MVPSGHHHRSGALRQTNKKNKRRTASKRSRTEKGQRGSFKNSGGIAGRVANSKADRRNQAAQRRQSKRSSVLQKRSHQPPRVIGVVGLGDDLLRVLWERLGLEPSERKRVVNGTAVSFLTATPGSVRSALDVARVADALLFVVGDNNSSNDDDAATVDRLVSSKGDAILTALKGQGLPTPITVHVGGINTNNEETDTMSIQTDRSERRSQLHRQQQLSKDMHRWTTTEFGDAAKVIVLVDDSASSPRLWRILADSALRPPQWVQGQRSYLLAEKVDLIAPSTATTATVQLTGFIRQGVWDVHSAVHIPGVGTMRCSSVASAGTTTKIYTADPELQEPLDMYATPDALMGEQNLIGFDEDDDEEDEEEPKQQGEDYQAAWLDALDDVDPSDAVTYDFNTVSPDDEDMMMDDDDDGMDKETRRKQFAEEAEFPDEVQVDEDAKASERFQRYRPLKNFRRTPWDPKENLPESYANIFHLRQFAQTQRAVRKDRDEVDRAAAAVHNDFFGKTPGDEKMDDNDDDEEDDVLEGCIPIGSYVTLTLENLSPEQFKRLSACSLVVATSLLQHETKVSVLHAGIKSTFSTDQPIKSKDVLTFRCGWREWQARPVFSQHNFNSDKHKLERFLPPSAFCCASFFGPVTYAPCPVLVLRGDEIVAVGSMLGADADRIVVKRILLTGYPVRVRKRTAIVKYMFHNPDDVKWFKPAGLNTKHGLQGHIVQSVGDHGTMKCLFNAPIQQHDTVCLPLYKRIFPKYAPSSDQESNTARSGLLVL